MFELDDSLALKKNLRKLNKSDPYASIFKSVRVLVMNLFLILAIVWLSAP